MYKKNVSYAGLGYAVAQLDEALRYKLKGRGFDSWWGYWDFLFA